LGFKYSLARLTAIGCTPSEMIYVAGMTGYDYVSIRPMRLGLAGEPIYTPAEKPEIAERMKRALKYTGVKVYDIELARINDVIDIAVYEPAIITGAQLGAKCIISSIWTQNKSMYIEKFGQLCDLAAKHGLSVALEFVPIAAVNTLAATKEVIDAAGRSNATYMIDTFHYHCSKESPGALDDIPPEKFKMAHICDGPAGMENLTDREELTSIIRGGRLYVGEGGVDVAGIISKLPKDVVLSIELPHFERWAELGFAEHARRCLSTAKEYFAKRGME